MNWIWAEKKKKTPLKFNVKNSGNGNIQSVVKVHIEFTMEHPQGIDLTEVIRTTEATFDLPAGVEIQNADITHIELLGES